jgi:hypothetical protein
MGHGGGTALHAFLLTSSFLDIAGTAFAGWLLESRALVALMAVCFVGWLMAAFRPRTAAL